MLEGYKSSLSINLIRRSHQADIPILTKTDRAKLLPGLFDRVAYLPYLWMTIDPP
jgi:hypothetical protein